MNEAIVILKAKSVSKKHNGRKDIGKSYTKKRDREKKIENNLSFKRSLQDAIIETKMKKINQNEDRL